MDIKENEKSVEKRQKYGEGYVKNVGKKMRKRTITINGKESEVLVPDSITDEDMEKRGFHIISQNDI